MKLFPHTPLIVVSLAMAGWLAAGPGDKPDPQKGQPPAKLREQSRVWIIRGIQSEFATVRKTLPRGDRGLPLEADGSVDEKELQQRLAQNGPALRPGEVVQITKINFRKDSIVFEINGGNKQKRKWYQGIQIGTGGGPAVTRTDTNPAPVTAGSYIELNFKRDVPDLTVDELKKILATVLDFSRRSPTVVYTESLPKEVQEAIKNHQVNVGMDRDMVLAARGRPDRKERQRKGRVETEDWIYGAPPNKILIVTFEGDTVVKVGQYTPGVAETPAGRAQPLPPDPQEP